MPVFDVTAPDGTILRVNGPEGATEKEAIAYAQDLYSRQQKRSAPTPPPVQEEAGFSPKDVGIALGQGIVGAGKSIADVFGADNAVSNYLGSISNQMGQAYTPGRQAEMQRREQLQKEAAASGSIMKEIQAYLGGIAEAPVQALAQGIGSIAPYAGTAGVGAIARGLGYLGGPTVRAVNTVVGMAQGAGTVKGSIYDNVKDELLRENPRMSEKEAKEKASKAQEYLGSNFLDIAAGAALGGVAARYGVENLLTPGTAAKLDASLLPRVGKAMLAEAPLEGLQGGQEQLAVNRALTDAGFRRDAMEGVFGSTIRDAVIGAMTAGVVGVRGPAPTAAPPVEPPPETPKTEATAPTTPAPTAPTNLFDAQGNLKSVAKATPEEIAAAAAPVKPTVAQLKEDAQAQLDLANQASLAEKQAADIEALKAEPKPSKFQELTPKAKDLLNKDANGIKPTTELTQKEIKDIAEANDIEYLQGGTLPLLYNELIDALKAKAGISNGPIDVEASGTSAKVSGKRRGVPTEGAGESNRPGVADTGSNVEPVEPGEGEQQPPLDNAAPIAEEVVKEEEETPAQKARFAEWVAKKGYAVSDLSDEELAELKKQYSDKTWAGEPAFAPTTERRYVEPGKTQTEEDLYPKAIKRREEQKAIAKEKAAAEPTLEEKIKLKEELEKVKQIASELLAGTEDGKKLYDSSPKNIQAQVDEVLDRLKNQKKPKVAKTRKRGEQPVGIEYNPAQYKKQLATEKREAKAAAKAAKEPSTKRLSLLEERLQQYRETKSFGVPLEALEALRGGTTVGMIADLMNGDLRGALQEIANDKSGEFTALDKLVAKRLLNAKTLPKVQVVPESQIGGSNGRYDAATDTAYVGENSMTSHTVLHEALHGFTLAIIKAHKDGIINNPGVRNLDELYEHLKATYPELQGKYGMESLVEFVSEVMSNSDFQEQLNAIPYKRTNIFTEFARAILRMLGISPTDNFTALAYAMVSTESILSEGRKLEETNPPPATAALANKPDVTGLKQEPKTIKPPPNEESFIEARDKFAKNIASKVNNPTIQEVHKELTTHSTWHKFVRFFANKREVLGRMRNSLERQNRLQSIGENKNDVANEMMTAAAKASNFDAEYNNNLRLDLQKTIGSYAKQAKIKAEQAMANLHFYFEVLHEPERRMVKYILNVPLSTEATLKVGDEFMSPADYRKKIVEFLNGYKEADENLRHKVVEDLRKNLQEVVMDKSNISDKAGILANPNDEAYNVIANRSSEAIARMKAELESQPDIKPYLDTTFKQVKDIIDKLNSNNIELNRIGNFWTDPVDNWKTFYGYANYVPFKGKPDTEIEDSKYDYNKKILVGYQEAQEAFGGRNTESDNIVTQVMIDSVLAARRAGYKDVTLSIKNAVNQGILNGDAKKVIPFDENRPEAIRAERGQNKIFHYEPNGDITVITLDNKEQREAIRNTLKDTNPFIDFVNSITSGMGQFHTRYNPAFAPVNFVGDIMTNSFTMGVDFGPAATAQLMKAVTGIVVGQNGIRKSIKVARAYETGKAKELEKYINPKSPDYDAYIADLSDYLKRGGKVSYMQAFSTDSTLEQAIKKIKRGGGPSTKEQVDSVIDMWSNSLEFASRTAAYRVAKGYYLEQNKTKNMSPEDALEDAKVRATYYAKNLANFEQAGEYGKVLGALYMFAKPAATGAVRAIEALSPMLRQVVGREKFDLDTAEGQALAKQALNGKIMFAALIGMGMAAYYMSRMLADDDEEGRNRVDTDDMDRWQKYMRFHIPKELAFGRDDVIVQMRWGYGLGTFASAGAQFAALLSGNSSFKKAGVNIVQTGLDSFLPLPISRIDPVENPAAWILDSTLPSAFRPFLEYTMNLDGLGREIYNNRQSRLSDVYTGGDNIPEVYKDAAIAWLDATGYDVSPNTLYFFANNFFDGIARIGSDTYNLGLVAAGQKEFNPKTDTIMFDSFFGAKSNFDARQFSEVEKQIKNLAKELNSVKDNPDAYMKFIERNPNAEAAIEFYDKGVGSDLRDLRAEANQIRRDKLFSPKDKKELLNNNTQMSNLVKRNMLMNFESLGYTP